MLNPLAVCYVVTYMPLHMTRLRITTAPQRQLDQLGIGIAGLCALHCVVTLVTIAGFGLGGHMFAAPEIHRFGLFLAFVIAAFALVWGIMRHRRFGPLASVAVGLVLMGAALQVPHGAGEFVLTLLGVSSVALGHVLNMRASKASPALA